MTLQNVSTADFCDVVSVLPCSPTNKGKQNIFDAVRKTYSTVRNQGVLPGFLIVIVVEPATLKKRLLVNWLAPKKGAIFSLIYFFESFCLYYISCTLQCHSASHTTCHSANSFPLLPLPIDCLHKTKTAKASKLSQCETSETFSEFECITNVLFTSKIQFLKVKSALNPDELRFTNGRR